MIEEGDKITNESESLIISRLFRFAQILSCAYTIIKALLNKRLRDKLYNYQITHIFSKKS